MSFDVSESLEALSGRLTRNVLLTFSIFISIAAYYYTVELYDPNKNFLSQVKRGVVQESYTFFSGSDPGFYIRIGQHLEKETANAGIRINNKTTLGGFDNALKVMNNRMSFGLVQEDTIAMDDFIRNHLRYITPLYLERMHILYRKAKFETEKDNSLDNNGQTERAPTLTNKKAIKEQMRTATVSTGVHGSGSKIIAGFIMEQCDIQLENEVNLPLGEALDGLKSGEVDVVFWIAGGPLPDITELFKSRGDEFGLMSVDPALVPKMNKDSNLKLRPTTFKDKYVDGEKVSTVGSFAYLVASKDVPNSAIMTLLNILEETKEDMQGGRNRHFQLNEFGFKAAFAQKYEGFLMELLRNIFLFLVSTAAATAIALAYLLRLSSGYKQVRHFKRLVDIYKDYLPVNIKLDENPVPYPQPEIWERQGEIITKLVRGMVKLLIQAKLIREDLETGGLTIPHYNHLLKNVNEIKGFFQGNLARRLNEVIERNTYRGDLELIRHYYTAGFLGRDDYRDLVVAFGRNGQMASTVEMIPSQPIEPVKPSKVLTSKLIETEEVHGPQETIEETAGASLPVQEPKKE